MHTFIVVVIALMLYPFSIHIEAAWLAALFYLGREHAQAEYRIIRSNYGGHRKNAPWWCGLDPKAWNKKSVLDWLGPLIVAMWAVLYG